MVRDALVFGREATKFHRNMPPLSRHLCLLAHLRQRKQVHLNFGTSTQNYTASNPKKIQYSSENTSTPTQHFQHQHLSITLTLTAIQQTKMR
jgi:hypothetical protein